MMKFVAIVVVLLAPLILIGFQNPQFVFALNDYTRDDFPPNFIFGSGTSAYQVEGAASEDGRTPSILDTMSHTGHFSGDNGDVACDEYHKYKDDVQLMVDTGLEAYRFSISWSRLIPNGSGPVNPKAVEYYNNLINEALNHGIQPHVTMMHLDPPQALEDAYGGWQDRKIVEAFTTYADICFQEFGDRVKHWTTINEPNCYASYFSKLPYTQGHNILLAHAVAVELYRQKYKAKQQGFVGMSVSSNSLIPERNTEEDIMAVERVQQFSFGWIIHPLIFGDYPATMKQILGRRIPSFSKNETKLIRGSFDFIGINSYGTYAVKHNPSNPDMQAHCRETNVTGGKFLQDILEYFKEVYGNPPLYVHENGLHTYQPFPNEASLHDTTRAEYLKNCIGSVLDAARNGSNVKGYFQWSFLDLFEFPGGYKSAYGLFYVDRKDPNLRRYPKTSARWYSTFLKGERSPSTIMLKSASWKSLEDKERQFVESNSNVKMFMKQREVSGCRCTAYPMGNWDFSKGFRTSS